VNAGGTILLKEELGRQERVSVQSQREEVFRELHPSEVMFLLCIRPFPTAPSKKAALEHGVSDQGRPQLCSPQRKPDAPQSSPQEIGNNFLYAPGL
jgi:hypothetical protein